MTGGYGRSGVPDIVGCYRGRFFGIECKAGRNTPTPLQQINLDDIEKQKGIALVVNEKNMHSVQDIFNPTDVNDKQMEFDFDYK